MSRNPFITSSLGIMVTLLTGRGANVSCRRRQTPDSSSRISRIQVFWVHTKLATLAFLHCLDLKIRLVVEISRINLNSKHIDKYKFALKLT